MTVLIKIIKLFFLLVLVIHPHYIFSQNYTKSTVVISPQSAVNVNNKYDNRKYKRTINNNNYETNNEYTTNNVFIFNVDTTKKEKDDPLKKYKNNKEYYIDYISNGLARVKRNGKYGFVNEQGALIIDYKYDNARIYSDSLIPVQLNNDWFVINRNDKLQFYVKDAKSINSYNNGFAYVFYKDKIALVNKKGQVSDKFDNIEKFDTLNLATAIYDKKFGLINTDLETIAKPIYSSRIEFNKFELAKLCKNKKYGFIDTQGNVIIKIKYKELSDYNNFGYIRFKKKRYGLMDTKGNIVLKNNFWLISDFDDFGYMITKERPSYTFLENIKGYISLGLFFWLDKVFEPNKLMNENFEFILNKVERIDKNTYYAIDGVFIFKKYGIFKNGELIVPIEYSKKEVLQKIVK